jgi:hypothetical protein
LKKAARRRHRTLDSDDDNQDLTPFMTIEEVKKMKPKISNTNMLAFREDSSTASTPRPEAGPSRRMIVDPTLPPADPKGSALTITADVVEAIVRKVMTEIAPPAKRRGFRARVKQERKQENSDDDDDDENDALQQEKTTAALAGARTNHLVSELR